MYGSPCRLDPAKATVGRYLGSAISESKVPKRLVPIYEQATAKYGLGEEGPSILAGINWVETGFGTNSGVSSAEAEGWMQFPSRRAGKPLGSTATATASRRGIEACALALLSYSWSSANIGLHVARKLLGCA